MTPDWRSNYPPGVSDKDIDEHYGSDGEVDWGDEDKERNEDE